MSPTNAPALLTATLLSTVLAACGGGADNHAAAPRAAARQANLARDHAKPAALPAPAAADDAAADPARGAAQALRAAPAAPQKMVLAYYSDYSNNYRSLTSYYANFNTVAIDFWNLSSEGVVGGNGAPAPNNAIAFLKSKKIAIYGCISNLGADGDWSKEVAHAAMGPNRAASVKNLVAFAKQNGFAGINIDFENVDQGDRAVLSEFSATLAAALHAQGMKLIMTVPAFGAKDEHHEYNWAFDLAALGKSADFIQIMTYDEAIPNWPAGPVAGSDWMEDALDFAVAKAPAGKILNGIPSYGYDWVEPGNADQLFWNKLPALLKQYSVTPRYDVNSNSITFSYKTPQAERTVWLENADSVGLKAGLVNAYGLAGTSVYALGMEDANFWKALNAGLRK
ncbi:MAG: glycosyl hydrolase family 18 protein [Pseudomonadota bacterium]